MLLASAASLAARARGDRHTGGLRGVSTSARCSASSGRRWGRGTPPSTPASAARSAAPGRSGDAGRRASGGGSARRAAAAARRARAAAAAPADQVGRWDPSASRSRPTRSTSVLMPTGRVLFWGRSPLEPGHAAAGQRHAGLRLGPGQERRRVHRRPAAGDRHRWRRGPRGGAALLLRPVAAAERRGAGDGRDARVPRLRGRRVDRERLQGPRSRLHVRSLDAGLDGAAVDAQGALVPHPGDARRRADRDPRRLGRDGDARPTTRISRSSHRPPSAAGAAG